MLLSDYVSGETLYNKHRESMSESSTERKNALHLL